MKVLVFTVIHKTLNVDPRERDFIKYMESKGVFVDVIESGDYKTKFVRIKNEVG